VQRLGPVQVGDAVLDDVLARRGELCGPGICGRQRVEVVEAPGEPDFVEHPVPGRCGQALHESAPGDVGDAAGDGDGVPPGRGLQITLVGTLRSSSGARRRVIMTAQHVTAVGHAGV
jgi:hypothetical protein